MVGDRRTCDQKMVPRRLKLHQKWHHDAPLHRSPVFFHPSTEQFNRRRPFSHAQRNSWQCGTPPAMPSAAGCADEASGRREIGNCWRFFTENGRSWQVRKISKNPGVQFHLVVSMLFHSCDKCAKSKGPNFFHQLSCQRGSPMNLKPPMNSTRHFLEIPDFGGLELCPRPAICHHGRP